MQFYNISISEKRLDSHKKKKQSVAKILGNGLKLVIEIEIIFSITHLANLRPKRK